MTDEKLVVVEARRTEITKQIRRYMDPFVAKDEGDLRSLKRDEALLEAEISRSASAFLKTNGCCADGARRKR